MQSISCLGGVSSISSVQFIALLTVIFTWFYLFSEEKGKEEEKTTDVWNVFLFWR
jgi:hypothetical protein